MDNEFFADYLERLENLRAEFRQQIHDLPPEALDWVPGPEMNSIGVLLAHTAGSLRWWIGDVAVGEPSGRDREREFAAKGSTAEQLLGKVDAVVEYVRGVLPRLREMDLAEDCTPPDRKQRATRGWALLHAMEHGYNHLGHIELTAQLWRQRRK